MKTKNSIIILAIALFTSCDVLEQSLRTMFLIRK